jgi:hypothetical protein
MDNLLKIIGTSLERNKDLLRFETGYGKDVQVLFVNKLVTEARWHYDSKEAFEKKAPRCQYDDCGKYVELKSVTGQLIYMGRCIMIKLVYDFMTESTLISTNKWGEIKKKVVKSDDLPAFMIDLLLELGYEFTIKTLPNLHENIWACVIGDNNAAGTLNVAPVVDLFLSSMASVLPIYTMHRHNFRYSEGTPLFYSACECLMNPMKVDAIQALEDKFKCQLMRMYMVNQLHMFKLASAVLNLNEELLVKDKPDVYMAMSQVFAKFANAHVTAKAVSASAACMQKIQPLFVENENEQGRRKGVGYLYRLCIDINDIELSNTLKSMLVAFSEKNAPVAEKQAAFCSQFKIVSFDTSCIHLKDVLDGCFTETECNDPVDTIIDFMRSKTVAFNVVTKRHMLIDTNVFAIVDAHFDRQQRLGGNLFGLVHASFADTMHNGYMLCIFMQLTKLFFSKDIASIRWCLSVCHYLLFKNVRAALDAQRSLEQEHVPFVHEFVAAIICKVVTDLRGNIDEATIVNLLAVFVGLMMTFDTWTNPNGLDGFPVVCTQKGRKGRLQIPDAKSELFSDMVYKFAYKKESDAEMPMRAKSLFGSKLKTTEPEDLYASEDEDDDVYATMALFFSMATLRSVRERALALARCKKLVSKHTQPTWPAWLSETAFPVFYDSALQEIMTADSLYFMPYKATKGSSGYNLHVDSVYADKTVPDCEATVLAANGKKPVSFQLYTELE